MRSQVVLALCTLAGIQFPGNNNLGRAPPPSAHLRLFWREKKIKFLFPAATEENIARVNLLRKASDSSILMAIDALDAILSIHLLPLAKI
jgi:hypothetical protein